MEEGVILQDLEDLARNLDIEIRYDRLEGPGGLCRYGGRTCLILDRRLSVPDRIRSFVRALVRYPLDEIYIRPHVRTLLERGYREWAEGA